MTENLHLFAFGVTLENIRRREARALAAIEAHLNRLDRAEGLERITPEGARYFRDQFRRAVMEMLEDRHPLFDKAGL